MHYIPWKSFACVIYILSALHMKEVIIAFLFPGDFPNPGIKLGSPPTLQADSLPTELLEKPNNSYHYWILLCTTYHESVIYILFTLHTNEVIIIVSSNGNSRGLSDFLKSRI